MAINFGYFAKESITSFKRNWVMSLGAIITIYLSLLLVGVSVGSGFVLGQVVEVGDLPGHEVQAAAAEHQSDPGVRHQRLPLGRPRPFKWGARRGA